MTIRPFSTEHFLGPLRATLYRTAVALLVLGSLLPLLPHQASAQQPVEGMRKIVTRVVTQYPSLARSMNIQGSVQADVLVAPNSTVKSVEVKGDPPICSSGPERVAPVEVGTHTARDG
ncbi:MAG: energy transducer TonB [Candidatus Sulfotelmatobacter sp.]